MRRGQREQNEAAGGPECRALRLTDGTIVMASVAVRRYQRTPNQRYGYLQFKVQKRTVTKYIGRVTTKNLAESLRLGWELLRSRKLVESFGWSWASSAKEGKENSAVTISRSENMRRIRSKDTSPELAVRKLLRGLGHTGYRVHRKDLPGNPDVAFMGRKKALFIHGCFWHGHDCKEGLRKPKSRRDYWLPKIEGNRRRDEKHLAELTAMGWDVLTVWECDLRDTQALDKELREFLR